MGLGELTEEEERLIDMENITIGELKNMFGEEATRRGLEYMRSLIDADSNFREAANPDVMTEGYREAGVSGDVEPVSNKWSSRMEEEGLGLNEEDE